MKKIGVFLLLFLLIFSSTSFAKFGINKTFTDKNTGETFDLSKNQGYFNKIEENKHIQEKRKEIRGIISLYNPDQRVRIPDNHRECFLIGYYEVKGNDIQEGQGQTSSSKQVVIEKNGTTKVYGFFDKKVKKETYSNGEFDIIHSEGIHTSQNHNDITYEKHHFNKENEKEYVVIGVQQGDKILEEKYDMDGEKTEVRYGVISDNNTIKMYRNRQKRETGKIVEQNNGNRKQIIYYDENNNKIREVQSYVEEVKPKEDDFKGFEGTIREKYQDNKLIDKDFMNQKEEFLNGNGPSLFDSVGVEPDEKFQKIRESMEWW